MTDQGSFEPTFPEVEELTVIGPDGQTVAHFVRAEPDYSELKYITRQPPLRWRIWWRFGFYPLNQIVRFLPVSEWRKDKWIMAVDLWAMRHIGPRRGASP